MEIVILILKIFGIILGSLFAVCLLLLIAATTVPVRYYVNAEIKQKKTSGGAALFWLFHIIDFRFFYGEDGIVFKLRILGLPIRLQEKKNRKPRPFPTRMPSYLSHLYLTDLTRIPLE